MKEIALIVLLILASATALATDLSACGAINTPDTYTLTQDVSSTGTCFTIQASDVIIDCARYNVTYGTSSSGKGFDINGYDRVTIKNCDIKQGSSNSNSHALRLSDASNLTIENNIINTAGTISYGIYVNHTEAAYIDSNNITAPGSASYPILLYSSANNSIILNNMLDGITASVFDGTSTNTLNYLVYNNSYGEIRWTDESFLSYLLFWDPIIPGVNIFIDNNTVAINTSAFTIGNINSAATITLKQLPFSQVDIVKRKTSFTTDHVDILSTGNYCLDSDCVINSYDSGTLSFNVSSLGSFSANEDTGFPAITDGESSPGSRAANRTIVLNASVTDDGKIDTVKFYIPEFGNLTATRNGDQFILLCSETGDCNTHTPGSYSVTSIWANDTTGKVSIISSSIGFTVTAIPDITLSLIYPVTNTNFTPANFSQFIINVSCFNIDCGELSVNLDPEASYIYYGDNLNTVYEADSSGNPQWNKTLANHDIKALATSPENDLYIATFYNWADGYILKFNSSGFGLWNFTLPSHQMKDLTSNTQGDIFAGTYYGYTDSYLIKYDSSGVQQWNASLPGQEIMAVKADSLGNSYVSTYNFGTGAAVYKYDSTGSQEWSTSLPGNAMKDVAVDAYGNLFAATYDYTDSIIFKLDPSGDQLWNFTLNDKEVKRLAIDSENYLVAVATYTSVTTYLFRFDSSESEEQWNTSYGGGFYDLAVDDFIYTAGNLYNTSDNYLLVQKFDSAGNIHSTIEGAEYKNAVAVAVPPLSIKGNIPMNTGEPFWTASSNPKTINLNQDESQLVLWQVNTTGSLDSVYEFFAFAYQTADPDYTYESSVLNVTIGPSAASVDIYNSTLAFTNSSDYSVFRFLMKNVGSSLDTLSWIFEPGGDEIPFSGISNSLEADEEVFVFVEQNYSSSGLHNATATGLAADDTDSQVREVSVG